MSSVPPFQRFGRNVGRYSGETIDIQQVLDEIQIAALKHGWRQDCFLKSEEFCLLAYHHATGQPRKRIYISTGIHGDEPAGPLAVRELTLLNRWPEGIDVWLCPCLNPTGFPVN